MRLLLTFINCGLYGIAQISFRLLMSTFTVGFYTVKQRSVCVCVFLVATETESLLSMLRFTNG